VSLAADLTGQRVRRGIVVIRAGDGGVRLQNSAHTVDQRRSTVPVGRWRGVCGADPFPTASGPNRTCEFPRITALQ